MSLNVIVCIVCICICCLRTSPESRPTKPKTQTLGYIDYGQRHHDGRIVQTWMIIVIMMDIQDMDDVHCTWFGCVQCGTNFWPDRSEAGRGNLGDSGKCFS